MGCSGSLRSAVGTELPSVDALLRRLRHQHAMPGTRRRPIWQRRSVASPGLAQRRRAPAESGVGNALTCRAPERPGSLPTRRSPPYGASAHRYALCPCATRREGALLRWQRCSCWRSGSLLRGWLWLPPSPTPPAQPYGPARRPPQPISRRQGTAGPPLAGPGWQRPAGPSRGPPWAAMGRPAAPTGLALHRRTSSRYSSH